jgi:glutamate formiminotransferase/glutamate formiminotransferase/formiminotetrahydrofolate cyclodeaminase
VPSPLLLAVPNVSEGRDTHVIETIAQAFRQPGARLLDVHSDADHHRSVFTLAAEQARLADTLLSGAQAASASVDVVARSSNATDDKGQHPHVGAIDVVPVVYLDPAARGAAAATALTVADRLAQELGIPVFLYGELTEDDQTPARTRAQIRRGGIPALRERLAADEIKPDFGPAELHPTAGATLVAARPPLVAFNIQLAPPATLADAERIAGLIREGGASGLPGVRAIAVELQGGVAQVSTNVERPFELTLAEVVDAVQRHAPVASAELVGLAPGAALAGFPAEVELLGFDPARHLLENALRS